MSLRRVNEVSSHLSLRPPRRAALEILDRVFEAVPLDKSTDPAEALEAIRSEYPAVTDFEREFPSLCFALATGFGKTRLMGAFIAYLHLDRGLNDFFVRAPNLTIYTKLIADFTPNTANYVFRGVGEFASGGIEVITGDNYESGRGVRAPVRQQAHDFATGGVRRAAWQGRFEYDRAAVHLNVFNISKINSEVRGGKAPRIKRLREYLGQSYFEYLAGRDDLVLLMDESHRYRGGAGIKVLNELRPILGLEPTATPQVESGTKTFPFKNVIYNGQPGPRGAARPGLRRDPGRSDSQFPRGGREEVGHPQVPLRRVRALHLPRSEVRLRPRAAVRDPAGGRAGRPEVVQAGAQPVQDLLPRRGRLRAGLRRRDRDREVPVRAQARR
ncbi:MAG TPA: DEAD/DEAH box helicase family protein [Isosphaeraceae bacterium]|jgi:type III restriction enzyme